MVAPTTDNGPPALLRATALAVGLLTAPTAGASVAGMGQLGAPVPVLRVLDGRVGREFYEVLGFELLWEHRFEPGMPLYQRLRRDEATIDLSEHYGDGIPGTALWVPVRDVRALHAELRPKLWAHQRPDLDEDAPGGPTFAVGDPYGNHLRFCQPTAD